VTHDVEGLDLTDVERAQPIGAILAVRQGGSDEIVKH
jgi:hypothetical protein